MLSRFKFSKDYYRKYKYSKYAHKLEPINPPKICFLRKINQDNEKKAF